MSYIYIYDYTYFDMGFRMMILTQNGLLMVLLIL